MKLPGSLCIRVSATIEMFYAFAESTGRAATLLPIVICVIFLERNHIVALRSFTIAPHKSIPTGEGSAQHNFGVPEGEIGR